MVSKCMLILKLKKNEEKDESVEEGEHEDKEDDVDEDLDLEIVLGIEMTSMKKRKTKKTNPFLKKNMKMTKRKMNQ